MYGTTDSSGNPQLLSGFVLSVLLHAAIIGAGIKMVFNTASDTARFNFVSVEFVSQQSSHTNVDVVQEELSIKQSVDVSEAKKPLIKPAASSELKKPAISKSVASRQSPHLTASQHLAAAHGNASYDGAAAVGETRALHEQTIISKLERVKRYPQRALTRRLEGDVLLLLEISASGEIADSSIQNSSGYSFFDAEVLSMVKRVGTFPRFESLPESQKLSYLIPISFRLTKS